jgi:hypothetical protein
LHCFWKYTRAQRLWRFMTSLFAKLADPLNLFLWSLPTWQQAFFVEELTTHVKAIPRLWLLLQGITIWTMWISRNHKVFNGSVWPHEHLMSLVWQGLREYARAAWTKCLFIRHSKPKAPPKALVKFDKMWCRTTVLCSSWLFHYLEYYLSCYRDRLVVLGFLLGRVLALRLVLALCSSLLGFGLAGCLGLLKWLYTCTFFVMKFFFHLYQKERKRKQEYTYL